MSDSLNKQPRLSPNDPEWSRLEYKMQLSIGSTTATLKDVWLIANPTALDDFEKKAKASNANFLESWVEISQLGPNNDL